LPAVGSPTATSTTATRSSPQPQSKIVYFADIFSAELVLVAVGPGPLGGLGVQLLATTLTGDRVRDIAPHVPADETPDSVFFLDPEHGWFATFSDGGGSENLYRTTNGGASWQSFLAPGHSLGAGSTDAIQFTTPQDGWLADIEPTGPVETLYHSGDGGASWQQVARTYGTPPLPHLGVVKFDSTGTIGWLGGGSYPGELESTRDQAHSWQTAGIPMRAQDSVDVPAIFSTTLIAPVTRCADNTTELRTYRSIDDGSNWSLSSVLNIAAGCQQVSAVFPTRSSGWAATLDNGRVVVERTTDQAQHWVAVHTPVLSTDSPPAILALDADHAWLQVGGLDEYGTRVYSTEDGGKTWLRIDQSITS
jgi:photosystem II stability/assembly factor-like uncharacterized protein